MIKAKRPNPWGDPRWNKLFEAWHRADRQQEDAGLHLAYFGSDDPDYMLGMPTEVSILSYWRARAQFADAHRRCMRLSRLMSRWE